MKAVVCHITTKSGYPICTMGHSSIGLICGHRSLAAGRRYLPIAGQRFPGARLVRGDCPAMSAVELDSGRR